jgi:hypothetical protein
MLLSVDGYSADEQFGGVTQTVRAGDPVTVVVERNGERRELKMVADRRPTDVPDKPTLTVSLGSDSMANVMFHDMDSLRLRLIQGGNGLVGVVTLPGADAVPVSGNMPAPGQILLRSESGNPTGVFGSRGTDSVTVQLLPEVRPPFSFFVFRGDHSDSLQSEMDRLNLQIRGLRARQAERIRELASAHVGRPEETSDPELLRLHQALDAAGHRAAELRSAMERFGREEATARGSRGSRGSRGDVPQVSPREEGLTPVGSTSGESVEQTSFRPLAPYLLGQNRAAGAEVVNLRPELAEYFRVEGGVLVVDVPDGTPAALAGVQPGDVLTQVGGSPIRNIQDLRLGLSKAGGGPLSLTLVRKGRTLEVQLPR